VTFRYPLRKVGDVEYEVSTDAKAGMLVPVTIFANESLLSKMLVDRTIDQAVNVSMLRGLQKHVVVLPDGHEGYGFPVGGVAAADADEGVISPGGIGYDINCGVRLIRTNLSENEVRPKLRELLRELFQAVPSGLGHQGAVNLTTSELDKVLSEGVNWAVGNGFAWKQDTEFCEENGRMKFSDPSRVSSQAKRRGAPQLGSLGSGNHFLELQTVDGVFDEEAAESMGIADEGRVCVLVHSGSRGLGHQVCSDYLKIMETAMRNYNITLPDRELACAPTNTREADDYRYAMGSALNFAWVNRQMITSSIRKAFEKVFRRRAEEDLGMKIVYDVAHNICKLEEHATNGKSRKVFVHRKGATRAFPKGSEFIPDSYRDIGQPVLIPGSMGTASWVLLGQEKAMQVSFGSAPHGAGRFMSRKAATRSYPAHEVKKMLEGRGILIEAASKEGVSEEAPGAYKDVDAVAEVSHQVGIATKVVRLTPMGVVKG
jgi:tRNA-splicing ligase RtcB